ncbi:class I adenylate-forming enzyme family protein, partial [Aestuariimicrobium ganziense]|uniref:class I adenylate-forming enzyme family protein n=1 Tax=Aestuariimicrobium ganziense TaxID=2773677 RepID=UPI0019430096
MIVEALGLRATRDPQHLALQVGDLELSFDRWWRQSQAVACGLLERSLGRGERVALWSDPANWLDYAVAYFGVLAAGGVAVPLPSSSPAPAAREVLDDCSPQLLVTTSDVAPPPGRPTVSLDELRSTSTARAVPSLSPSEPAQILYTSGTTGRRKGVLASHGNLAAGLPPRRPPYLGHSHHALHAFPMGTNAAQAAMLATLVARPTLVIEPYFEADAFCEVIEACGIGSAFLVPAMITDLVRSGALERHDLSSLVLVSSTAAPLPRDVAGQLLSALPHVTLVDTYTTTEASPAQTVVVVDPSRPGTLGRPADPTALQVRDPQGRPQPAGTPGAVWLRTPGHARRYWGDGEATAAVVDGAWVRTGDIGVMDETGHLSLLDREADLVDAGGHNVSTLRVEDALRRQPGINEAAVFGVTSPGGGSVLAAAVVSDHAIDPAGLRRSLRDLLAPHEVPALLERVERLPHNEGGKVQ